MKFKKEEYILIDSNSKEVFRGKLTALPLSEDSIINLSIKFYDDDSPCFIHRSAVMKKMFVEIEDYFKEGLEYGKKEWSWEELTESIKRYLSSEKDISKIRVLS
jgi:hypothetical protein